MERANRRKDLVASFVYTTHRFLLPRLSHHRKRHNSKKRCWFCRQQSAHVDLTHEASSPDNVNSAVYSVGGVLLLSRSNITIEQCGVFRCSAARFR